MSDMCEACEVHQATKVCHGPDVEPWRLCDCCMDAHAAECDDLAVGRALVEGLGDTTKDGATDE